MAHPDEAPRKLPIDLKVFGVTIALTGVATLVRDFVLLTGAVGLGPTLCIWLYYISQATLAVMGLALLLRKTQALALLVVAVAVQFLAGLALSWETLSRVLDGDRLGWWRQVCDVVVLHGLWGGFVVFYLVSPRTRAAVRGKESVPEPFGAEGRLPHTVKLLALASAAVVASDILVMLHDRTFPFCFGPQAPSKVTAPVIFAVDVVILLGAVPVLFGRLNGVRVLAVALLIRAVAWAFGMVVALLLSEARLGFDEYNRVLVWLLVQQGLWSLFPAAYLATVYWDHRDASADARPELS